MKIRIAKDFEIPVEAVTQTFAAIGRKGAGKTYLATMIAEQMLDVGAQVIVFDPVGNWYGLRVGADGKSKGKEIFVIGGEHGDVPIAPEAGARIARLLVEKRISAVLDISSFRIGERKRFAAEFAEEFFHLKKSQRSPVHLFIEEAQLFIPQRVGPDEARMVGAWESIVRLGRNYGVGATLVTQRPQSVNKEVLSQVECLCVLQVNGTHERKALEEWVQEAGADRKLVGELPGLARGEGYVWSPSWLRVFKKVHFAKKTTFDASATPEVGRESKAAQLSSIDVEALKSDMAEVVKLAEQDDPKALKRRIRELQFEINTAGHIDPAAISRAEIRGYEKGSEEATGHWLKQRRQLEPIVRALAGLAADLSNIACQATPAEGKPAISTKGEIPAMGAKKSRSWYPVRADVLKGGLDLNLTPSVKPLSSEKSGSSVGQRIIDTIGMLVHRGLPVNRESVARWMGIHPNGGRYNTTLAELRSSSKLDGMMITDPMLVRSYPFDNGAEGVLQALSDQSMRVVFQAILSANQPLSREGLAQVLNIHPNGGRFNTTLAWLRTMGVIPERGAIEPTPGVFQ